MKKLQLMCCLLLAAESAQAYATMKHKSLRPLAMGNAYVALALDKEALHFNPAGLAMMNLVGNYNKRPDLGYLPRNFFDARTSVGLAIQGPSYSEAMQGYRFYQNHSKTFNELQGTESTQIPAVLASDSNFYNDFMFLDRRTLGFGPHIDLELAFPHFGGTIWTDTKVEPFVDAGVIVPGVGIRKVEAQINAEANLAFSATKNVFWGGGIKFTQGAELTNMEIGIDNAASIQDTLTEKLQTVTDNAANIDKIGTAVDLGVLYQWQRDIRLGASLQDFYLGKFMDSSVTPDLSLGIAYSPRRLQKNSNYGRSVNFALDFADLLNSDRGYKFFSKVNFGMEVEQVLLAFPYVRWASDLRAIKVRGGVGFKGGYWSAGGGLELLRIFTLEAATWAEERGYVTGQNGERYYAFNIGIGL